MLTTLGRCQLAVACEAKWDSYPHFCEGYVGPLTPLGALLFGKVLKCGMNALTTIRRMLFSIHPRLVGSSLIVLTSDKCQNFTGDWDSLPPDTYRWIHSRSFKEALNILDFSEEALTFFSKCQSVKISPWEWSPDPIRMIRSRKIWFLDASDAIQFKLVFGGNESIV